MADIIPLSKLPTDLHSDAGHAFIQGFVVVRHMFRSCGGIVGILTRNDAQNCRRVCDVAAPGANAVEKIDEREHTVSADPSPCWFEPGDPVRSRWKSDRAAGIGRD